jgi:hypothetical protein
MIISQDRVSVSQIKMSISLYHSKVWWWRSWVVADMSHQYSTASQLGGILLRDTACKALDNLSALRRRKRSSTIIDAYRTAGVWLIYLVVKVVQTLHLPKRSVHSASERSLLTWEWVCLPNSGAERNGNCRVCNVTKCSHNFSDGCTRVSKLEPHEVMIWSMAYYNIAVRELAWKQRYLS